MDMSYLKKGGELLLYSAVVGALIAGCGGGGSGGGAATTTNTNATITPYKGPFSSGTVTLKDANGNPVTLISGGTVNSSGVIDVTYSTNVVYPLVVEVTGSYYNEITGTTETATAPLRSIITSASSAVPVTIVTETAVADLQNRIGTFSSSTSITAASAVAALDTAGSNFGIPASSIPVFDITTKKTGDGNTILLSALAVIANSQGTGTLSDKVKTLAHTMATLNAASAPSDVVSQAAFNAAIIAIASSVAAPGVTPPTAPTIKTFTLANLAGTWTRHRLQAGRSFSNASGVVSASSNWEYGTDTWDESGNVIPQSAVNSTGNASLTSPFKQAISADGSIADDLEPTYHGTMSSSKNLIVGTRTAGNGVDPRLVINLRQDSAVTFTAADFAGTWDRHVLKAGRTFADGTNSNKWEHGIETWDANGNATEVAGSTVTSDGSVPNTTYLPFSITSTGTVTVPGDASVHGTMSVTKDLVVATKTAGNGIDVVLVIFQKK